MIKKVDGPGTDRGEGAGGSELHLRTDMNTATAAEVLEGEEVNSNKIRMP